MDINDSCFEGVPTEVCKQKIRRFKDGTFGRPRKHRQAIAELNANFVKLPGELKWYAKGISGKDIIDLQPILKGKYIYMIGKGPSLDRLSKADFPNPDAVIMCVNESIHKVESLDLPNVTLAMQHDVRLKRECLPKRAAIIINPALLHWYHDIENKYVLAPPFVDEPRACLTSILGLKLAKKFGCLKITFLCFDACIDGSLDYADCIGHTPARGGSPQRFLEHCQRIKLSLDNHPHEFIKIKAPELTSDDTRQPSKDSPVEHRESVPVEPQESEPTTEDLSLKTEPSPHEPQPDHSESEQ